MLLIKNHIASDTGEFSVKTPCFDQECVVPFAFPLLCFELSFIWLQSGSHLASLHSTNFDRERRVLVPLCNSANHLRLLRNSAKVPEPRAVIMNLHSAKKNSATERLR